MSQHSTHSIAITPPEGAEREDGPLVGEVMMFGVIDGLHPVVLNQYPDEAIPDKQFYRQLLLVGENGKFGQLITEVRLDSNLELTLRVWHTYGGCTYELVLPPITAETLRDDSASIGAIFRLLLLHDILPYMFNKT